MARQLSRESGPAERAEFDRLLGAPELRAQFDASARDWQAAALPAVNVDRAWVQLQKKLHSHTSENTLTATLPLQRRWWPVSDGLLRAAAVGFVVVTAGVVWARSKAVDTESAAAGGNSVVATTKVAERAQVRLPDGTQVQLGAASSLRTLSGYGGSSREVELVGEAAFHVIHDAARPFRVRAGAAVIEDLGTRFVVRAVMQEPVRVAVSEGSVSVGRSGDSREHQAQLQPRDVAVLGDSGDAVVSRNVDVAPYTAWTSGRLVFTFSDESLRQAIGELERWYDVRFEVADATLLNRTLNVTFNDRGIDDVLEVMGTMLGVHFEREGRVVRVAAPARTGMALSSAPQVGGGA